jgi:ADP-ribosylglycohydrolase
MIAAIAGDIIGSVYEWENIKTKQPDLFRPDCFFTDDTVLTVALADSILTHTDWAPATAMENVMARYRRVMLGKFTADALCRRA